MFSGLKAYDSKFSLCERILRKDMGKYSGPWIMWPVEHLAGIIYIYIYIYIYILYIDRQIDRYGSATVWGFTIVLL